MIRVLAVEDSPTQAEAIRNDLAFAGFDVTVVTRPREALELLRTERFDLLLSDVVMPQMDGYELCRQVKKTDAGRELPVVLLTSLSDPLDVVKGLESGADNFMRKPYQPEQLGARLRTTLHNRELRSTGRVQMGIELSFLDRTFQITAERQQILDLLISTFEELVVTTREVRAREEELTRLHGELEHQLDAAQLERNRLQAVLDAVPVPVAVVDEDGHFSHLSRMATEVFGTTVAEARQHCAGELAHFVDPEGERVRPEALPLGRALASGEDVELGSAFDLFLVQADGSQVPVEVHASPVRDERGRVVGAVAAGHLLTTVIHHDPVTRLPTRTAFANRIAMELTHTPGAVTVVLLGLDRFDSARGAAADSGGNRVLEGVAIEIRDAVAQCTDGANGNELFLAYLGGDQFGVVLSGPDADVDGLRVVDAVRSRVADWSERAIGVRVTASAGTVVSGGTDDASQLLAAAGAALRRARAAGGDRVEFFDPEASRRALEHVQLEVELCSALERGEVFLQYQPEVDLASGRLVGFEALARWQHRTLGFVPPDVFIPLAEESSLILGLGRHVLETACRQLQAWRRAGWVDRDLVVAVNLSPRQIRPELVDEVVDVLARTAVDGRHLVLEVTESAAMEDAEKTMPVLDALRRLGVRISLDDFGTGYSSLAHLGTLQVDQLKLDRSFVSELGTDGTATTIAQTVVALGHALGVRVLAEGVEERQQADVLRMLGCDDAQGYLFSRPLDAESAGQLLRRGHGQPGELGHHLLKS